MSELKPIQFSLSDEERYNVMAGIVELLEKQLGYRPTPQQADDHALIALWVNLQAEAAPQELEGGNGKGVEA